MNWFPLLTKSAHRISLERYIRQYAPQIHGSILDVGSKDRRYDHFFSGSITACDLIAVPEKKVEAADIHNLPYKTNQFDAVVCFEVLEYTTDPLQAFKELIRVTKPKGIIFVSSPFLNYYHDDMTRITEGWIKHHLLSFNVTIHIEYIGNSYTIITDIIRRKVIQTPYLFLRLLYYPFLWLLGLGVPFSWRLQRDTRLTSGYFIVLRKK